MVALATCGSRLRNPWLLSRCSTGAGWANPGRRGVPSDHRATRSDRCAVLIADFTFEVWPGVRRAGLRRLRSGASQKRPGAAIWAGAVPPGGALSAGYRRCDPLPGQGGHPVACHACGLPTLACRLRRAARLGESGVTEAMHDELRRQCQLAVGRRPERTAAVIDSQSVKAAETHWQGSRGFDSPLPVATQVPAVDVRACPTCWGDVRSARSVRPCRWTGLGYTR
jgi:hypothetical protein